MNSELLHLISRPIALSRVLSSGHGHSLHKHTVTFRLAPALFLDPIPASDFGPRPVRRSISVRSILIAVPVTTLVPLSLSNPTPLSAASIVSDLNEDGAKNVILKIKRNRPPARPPALAFQSFSRSQRKS
ncbi:hypothetical protein EVAR_22210_1 [Eumeta japonica]|uniref:Uncharacterized protein n=1 Tax=Eumeta variegata TaxID=151549 RepID=A0A4C1UAE5_EUMVA|nr:hypothetical protein EVAR_22210_1 [Eumeta japonica]